jgi:hypothetical protein
VDQAVWAAESLLPENGTLATHLPTQAAYYLLQLRQDDHAAFRVTDAAAGPNTLHVGLVDATKGTPRDLTIARMGGPTAQAILATPADVYLVPTYWQATHDLESLGLGVCMHASGLDVMARDCPRAG